MTSREDFDFEEIKAEAKFKLMPKPEVSDRDYTEFRIRTIKKVVKREDVLVRQTFYTGLTLPLILLTLV